MMRCFLLILCLPIFGAAQDHIEYPPPSPDRLMKASFGIVVDQDYQEAFGIKVKQVIPKSAAHLAGVKAGDILTSVLYPKGWYKVDITYFQLWMQNKKAGETVKFRVQRDGQLFGASAVIQGESHQAQRHYSTLTVTGTYLVYLPNDYEKTDKSYPVCVLLHGNGSQEGHGLVPKFDRDQVIYVAPRAPYPNPGVFVQGSRGWSADHPDLVYVDRDNPGPLYQIVEKQYVAWVKQCVDEVRQTYRIKGDKIHVFGHSQGAAFAHLFAFAYPEQVVSYYACSGNLRKKLDNPESFQKLKAHQVKVITSFGNQDQWAESTPLYSQRMKEAGIDIDCQEFDVGHGVEAPVVTSIQQWLDEVVLGQE